MFKILVVEDNQELNRSVCAFLNQSGYEAFGCLNASDAYDTMYSTTFDLIVSDIMMPNIDGYEFAKTVRELDENIPILFMTARDDFASKQRGYRVGIDDYMVKPIDLDELFLRIGALLRRAKIASSRRLENQQIYPQKEVFDLGEQLCECLLAFENVWEEKGIEIDTDIADDIKIESDRELLPLVWNNLFSNALKFTPRGGSVSVRMTADADYAVVQVDDTGCGISPAVGAHIFEKFYQGDTSHAVQGNGLGLALVKRVVDIIEGDISVTSEVGKGSRFMVKVRRGLNETG